MEVSGRQVGKPYYYGLHGYQSLQTVCTVLRLEWDHAAGAWNGISGSLEWDQQQLGTGSAAAWNGISGSLERDQRELGKAMYCVQTVVYRNAIS